MHHSRMSVLQKVFTGKTMQQETTKQSDQFIEAGEVVDIDAAVLNAQGHAAELERSFSWLGATGLAFRYVCF